MEVSNMAYLISCGVTKFPLKYLGVPVGCNMAWCSNWKAIIHKFSYKLSLWKARLLSVGGHLTLIRSVLGNLPTYYISLYRMLVQVQQNLESIYKNFFIGADQGEKKLGDIGIGSIYGLNIGLLFKWIWRLMNHPSNLWAHVVINIHGPHGGIFDDHTHSSNPSPWGSILKFVNNIKRKGIALLSMCSRKIGNGEYTRFWEVIWCGDKPLKLQFPRILLLDTDRECLVINKISLHDWTSVFRRAPRGGAELVQLEALQAVIGDVVLTYHCDSWKNSLDVSGGFTVASARHFVDITL
ncbi:RNA-directed DNA polymerase, eukaryota, Reverse transcriptase zinc-binding domain protein [Artemisia annua]|uniref:RNA-directed DNA polymerase, eukaryota, Reverse transcriptase zinc-binding domain protein n=1 Tax=Artemisia annua TaxID=35608 RepID=A0A2U1PB78_ARTAN|nr:RNA-directed DNA polymerase, eukaryota, Reverse transcriptase zinc-binding domain protein [Artemisia annua]